ncbi:hypothetical protein SAMN05421644_11029 [Allochromatium warmingii]|uniref:Uncharacterized protein n=1 Tax=Allochromatium warmingii TaxID=61595 RepID=A0A1H3DV34_ALLWA|nr:hypothetical protein [Allochromatium warmingii]SDX70402.1 hypothetical protein SAMN05421644_11029 [Allochromatium warmingii]
MKRVTTLEYLQRLTHDAGWIELCRIVRGVEAVWDDRPEVILNQAREWAGAGNLFTTLQRIDRDALVGYLTEQRQADPRKRPRTPDHAVKRYCRLFFDFDPVRPTGTSSTADELDEALIRAQGLRDRLLALDWPLPAIAMSGNGWHLQYRTALPNTPETREQLALIYAGLHREFSDDVVEFDRAVRNPARLCALYGSVKRKGPNTADRPHRRSAIWLPSDWKQVLPKQVAALADYFARQSSQTRSTGTAARSATRIEGQGNYASLDVVRWFQAHDAYVGHLEGNKHGVRCPWSSEHTSPSPKSGSDTIVFESDGGWPGFYCHHAHCQGRTIRDVMALWGDADAFCSEAFQSRRAA